MDSFALSSYVIFCLVLVVPLFVALPPVRVRLLRLGARALERLTAEPEIDQDTRDLYEAIRRERLLRDVARLRRVLAHDEHMSAVRQIGNRMAYDRLLQDLGEVRDVAASPALVPQSALGWSAADAAASPAMPSAAQDSQYRPRVETLELGWRR